MWFSFSVLLASSNCVCIITPPVLYLELQYFWLFSQCFPDPLIKSDSIKAGNCLRASVSFLEGYVSFSSFFFTQRNSLSGVLSDGSAFSSVFRGVLGTAYPHLLLWYSITDYRPGGMHRYLLHLRSRQVEQKSVLILAYISHLLWDVKT